MAQSKKKVTRKGPGVVKARETTPKREPQPLGRGIAPPIMLQHAPKTYAFRLEPLQQINGRPIHAPIAVWGYPTETSWKGWIQERRTLQIHPTEWAKDKWRELPANPGQTGSVVTVAAGAIKRVAGKR